MQKIILENFGKYKNMTLEPKQLGAYFASNGKGKTTIQDALRFAVTGEVDTGYIYSREAYLRVTIIYNDGLEVERTRHKTDGQKVRVNGKPTTIKALNELYKERGMDVNISKYLSFTKMLEDITPEAMNDLLLNYIPEEVPLDTVYGYIETDDIEIPEAKKEEISNIVGKDTVNANDIAVLHKEFYAQRTNAKASLRTIENQIAHFEGSKPERDEEAIQEAYDKLLKEAETNAAAVEKKKVYERELAENNRNIAYLNQLKEKLNNLEKIRKPSVDKEALQESIDKNISDMDELKKTKANLEANQGMLEKALKTLDTDVCPLSGKLKCTTDKTPVLTELQGQIAENEKLLVSLNKKEESLKKVYEDLKEKDSRYRKYEVYIANKNALEEQIKTAEKQIKTLQKPEDIAVSDYNAALKKLSDEKTNVIQYKVYVQDLAKKNKVAAEVTTLELLVKAFDKKGCVIENILKYYMEVFENSINATLTTMSKMKAKLAYQNGVAVYVCPDAIAYRKISRLSSGEKTIAVFAIMNALNQMAGFQFMFLDDLEKLDGDAFRCLVQAAKKVSGNYENIFLTGVNHPNLKEILHEEGVL